MSGGMLLARQTFRRLFRSSASTRRKVWDTAGDVAITDLKGSTAMYERLGDLNAYCIGSRGTLHCWVRRFRNTLELS